MVLIYSKKSIPGLAAPDFSLPGTDGKNYSLSDFQDKKILIIAFTCNHCPYAKAAKSELIKLHEKYLENEVQFVAINPNDSETFPEDSFEKMKEKGYNYHFPYLRDKSQEVAKSYEAICTPDIFVYDQQRKLAYHGRINDNWQEPDKVATHDLDQAIQDLLDDKTPSENQEPSMGCSIKWKD